MTPYTTRDIRVVRSAVRALRHPSALAAAVRFVRTVLVDFFWLQFSVKWGLRRMPIVSVDHPLDDHVPFAPENIGAYLDFVAFWIRPLGHIGRRCGDEAMRRHTVEFLGLIERCYREAAGVYRFRMSTTRRPRYRRGRFLAIHLLDPHYLCVPSLHVMIVVLAYTYHRRAFAQLGVTGDEAEALDAELFAGAVEITETVLYIKQHSVNCIPAALYAMTGITPDDVTPAEVDAFVDRLFADAPLLSGDTGERIRTFVRTRFAELVADGAADDDWTPAVRRFLATYPRLDA